MLRPTLQWFLLVCFLGTGSAQPGANITQFGNYTIEWIDLNILTCVTPLVYTISVLQCLPEPNYIEVEDVTCLQPTTLSFDDSTCWNDSTGGPNGNNNGSNVGTRASTVSTTTLSTGSRTSTTPSASSSTSTTRTTTTSTVITTSVTTSTTITTTTTTRTTSTSVTTTTGTSSTSATTTTTRTTSTSMTTTTGTSSTSVTTTSQSTTSATTRTTSTSTSTTSQSTSTSSSTTTTTRTSTTTTSANIGTGTQQTSREITSQITSRVTTTPSITLSTTTPNPYRCPGENIGTHCNISSDPCEMAQPCYNDGTCFLNRSIPAGYQCHCQDGFVGEDCEIDQRPCKEDTCWNNGTCIEVNQTLANGNDAKFICHCSEGFDGLQCELQVDLCGNITCQNKGFCRTVNLVWKCICLDPSLYYGELCEHQTASLTVTKALTRSFASVAITVIVVTCSFVLLMDVLKYLFHIDPIERPAPVKKVKKSPGVGPKVAVRFQYIP